MVRYCGQACQVADWRAHRAACRELQARQGPGALNFKRNRFNSAKERAVDASMNEQGQVDPQQGSAGLRGGREGICPCPTVTLDYKTPNQLPLKL